MTSNSLSLATFDELCRSTRPFIEGLAETELLKILQLQENFRLEYIGNLEEVKRLREELNTSLQSVTDLETKICHAHRLIETEARARKKVETECDKVEHTLLCALELLDDETDLRICTKNKLAALLNNLPRKRKLKNSHLEETENFLKHLSITQFEDDLLSACSSCSGRNHKSSTKNAVPYVGSKTQRLRLRSALNATSGSESIYASMKRTLEHTPETTQIIRKLIHDVGALGEREAIDQLTTSALEKPAFRQIIALSVTPEVENVNSSIAQQETSASSNMSRAHNFAKETFIKIENCVNCQKKIRFGMVGFHCRNCSVRCHEFCRSDLKIPCVSGTKKYLNR